MGSPIFFPALRGMFGDWVYYSCLIRLDELAKRVHYAREVHQGSKKLSDYIQRSLEESRQKAIAEYLASQEQRFFNSLVIAVYGGAPKWFEAGQLRPASPHVDVASIPDQARYSIGFLKLEGNEKLFALDGQHRLSGIKLAVHEGKVPPEEEASVLLVGHQNTRQGLERTRRLFVTLNKTAVAVPKRDIIALDEDDVPAITVRSLVERRPEFKGDRIAFNETSNLSADDRVSFTSIVALYDAMMALFTKYPHPTTRKRLRFNRPAPEALEEYYDCAVNTFQQLGYVFPPLGKYMVTKDFKRVARALRKPEGGHILFRPVGLIMIVKLVAKIARYHGLDVAIQEVSKLPQWLHEPPYRGVLWSVSQKKMISDGKGLTARLLTYMLGDNKKAARLKADYAKALDSPSIDLPGPVSNILS